ncbi:hypothetical protein FVA74_10460 [Salinibacterium sp. dk2585]|uniref:hypothetical protein n=1 Tax=unclassified Salinibacterium TaxID=2632331 RepID=UPI0011C24378|nr:MULTISPECIES: hypothetical protein [unclassified Salinibacterium]QEE61942.1 hypothetical protein FVA74_10460 [Salinibacterium sp. dk2585]TXK54503.1 hypothetical protein FVP63_05500 [Salinibacterium sp. dk5596]
MVGALLALLALLPAPAWADPAAAPEASQASQFSVTSPSDGAFMGRTGIVVAGTGSEIGATVQVAVDGTPACTADVEADASDGPLWQCAAVLANGADRLITATESSTQGETSQSIRVHVLGSPTIHPSGVTTGLVSGTALPGSTVVVTLAGDPGGCTASASAAGGWSCVVTANQQRVPSGTYQVAARQAHAAIGPPHSYSDAVSRPLVIDTTPPQPPVIVSPAQDHRFITLPATFAGTGESGATVTVSLNRVPVCTTLVIDGRWSCSGGSALSAMPHEVRAIQVDAALNHSSPSAPLRVLFGPESASPTPRPAPAPPGAPSPAPSPSDATVDPSAPPEPSYPDPRDFGSAPPLAEGAGADAFTNWGTPTDFGAGIPSIQESIDRGNWSRAPFIALAAIALIALPSRLLASELRGRFRQRPAIPVRNRDPVPLIDEHTVGMSPWLSAALPFAVTVAFMVASNGVEAEVRYLRLAAAVAIALGVLNLVGVTIATRFGRLWQGIDGRLRFRPLLLVAAIFSGLLSRIVGLTPPFVTGTLIGVRMPFDTPVRGRAIVNLLQVGSVLVLGLIGWIGHSLVGEVVGFWPSLLSEIFAALCLVGVGSTLVLLLPVGALPGRVLWEWHSWAWAGIALVGYSLAFGILLGGADAHWPLAIVLIIAASIAALFIAAWAILRFLVSQPD